MMDGSALTLVGNVGQLVGEEFRQLRGVGGEVAELRDELATMNALLRMHSEADDGAVDHFIREWMKQVRELAYDSEDCIHLYIFRIMCRPSYGGALALFRHVLATLSPRRRLAADIKALRARAVAISERHARYGVSREALRRSPHLPPAPTAAAAPSPSAPHALRPAANDSNQFVGMRDQANTLAERVNAMDHSGPDNRLEVFSIVGFGGLGKTTLAVEVCRQLETEFQRQAQVSVSQAFDGRRDLTGLLKRVLQQIVKSRAENEKGISEEKEDSVENIDTMGVDDLAGTLKELLRDKRYLILIDDVWTIAAWDAIRSKLPENNCGSRIIVTTRIETVAKECSDASVCGENIYQIKPLNLEDAKKLFLRKAFGSMDDASCPIELKDEMEKILKKCGGLPLAIISIASLLANYKSSQSLDMWETVRKSIGSQMESNPTLEGMRHIIELSYNHLPYHLKVCMMYLSIFPEDFVIKMERLLYRWIAEGLVEEKRGLTLMEVAEAYFNELISRSMIDPVEGIKHDGRVQACRVHDMMLEVMVSKSLEANFVSLVGAQYEGMSYDRIRRLSIHGVQQEPKDDSSSKKIAAGRGNKRNFDVKRMNVQHVRSLTIFNLQGKLLDRLGEFTLLRVLDLEGCKGLENKHMWDICRMHLLRFLSVRDTDISLMPPKVGELEHLQTLDASGTFLDGLPQTVTKLEKLERVNFRNKHKWDTMWTPRPGICRMKALREVDFIIIDDVQVAREIGELGQLRELGIFLHQSESSENQEVLKELALSLSKTYSLRSLSIGRFCQGPKALNFLLDLPSPPRLLRFLYIDGGMDKLPNWFESLSYLHDIRILWARLDGDQVFGVLCKLPNLQNISLGPGSYTGHELVARTTQNFPALRFLSTHCPSVFPRVIRFEEGSMTKVERLSVRYDANEKSIVGIKHLVSLKEVQLTGTRDNSALNLALEQLKAESETRPMSNRFKVTARYD